MTASFLPAVIAGDGVVMIVSTPHAVSWELVDEVRRQRRADVRMVWRDFVEAAADLFNAHFDAFLQDELRRRVQPVVDEILLRVTRPADREQWFEVFRGWPTSHLPKSNIVAPAARVPRQAQSRAVLRQQKRRAFVQSLRRGLV
jgi:hypothetical protein